VHCADGDCSAALCRSGARSVSCCNIITTVNCSSSRHFGHRIRDQCVYLPVLHAAAALGFSTENPLPFCCRFSDAIRAGRINHVQQVDNCSILAAVGQQMASRKGVSAIMFSSLAKANINVRCPSMRSVASVRHVQQRDSGCLLMMALFLQCIKSMAARAV
jgi:hypothetical protein